MNFKFQNPFREIEDIDPAKLADIQQDRLRELLSEGVRPKIGAVCHTSGSRTYLWGPGFTQRTNQWQDYVIMSRKRDEGFIIHYAGIDDFRPSPWTHFVDRYRIAQPLSDESAMWLRNMIVEARDHVAPILSGQLLADFIDWLDANGKTIDRPIIFTTFDPFPRSMVPRLMRHFADWCDYMRSWDGGLTWFRCRCGTLHTFDNITIIKPRPGQSAMVTDLMNMAQHFVGYEPGDIVEMDSEPSTCACGLWHFNFRLVGNTNWSLVDAHDHIHQSVVSMNDVTNAFQVLQKTKGRVSIVRHGGWSGVDAPELASKLEKLGFAVDLESGSVRRNHKKPFFFSRFMTDSRWAIHTGAEPNVKQTEFTAV